MADPIVVSQIEEGIAQLTLDDPANENRLSEALCAGLMQALAELAQDRALRVLLLAGRPEVFCAGATLETLRAVATGQSLVRDLQLPERMLAFPVPIVGALQGHAVGGGLMLALCCDLLVAAEGARYGVNFTTLGFTPGMGTTGLIPALAGHFFASEMILTGKLYKGRELRQRGLFNDVLPAAQVYERALDLARQIAEKPRHVVELLKETLALPRRAALQQAMSREHLLHQICFARPDTLGQIDETYLR